MRRYLPIVLASVVVLLGAVWVVSEKKSVPKQEPQQKQVAPLCPFGDSFQKEVSKSPLPHFLHTLKLPQPFLIDLSQKEHRGLALYYGRGLRHLLHPKVWERYGHFSTYVLDKEGNLYLTPMPFISIEPQTFAWQKAIYRLESQTGKLKPWRILEEVEASASNPYGVTSIAYDKHDHTLWVGTLNGSTYTEQKGVIYHIDIASKRILGRIEGVDALSLQLLQGKQQRWLLIGSARGGELLAYGLECQEGVNTPQKLFSLPNTQMQIRKMRVIAPNTLLLETIPFSYTLITQSAKEDRVRYIAKWYPQRQKWEISLQMNENVTK